MTATATTVAIAMDITVTDEASGPLLELAAIALGGATFHRVMNSEWPAGTGHAIREAIDGLTFALETYRDVLNDLTHPSAAYPELECEDDAFALALAKAAEDAGEWAGELDRLVPVAETTAGDVS